MLYIYVASETDLKAGTVLQVVEIGEREIRDGVVKRRISLAPAAERKAELNLQKLYDDVFRKAQKFGGKSPYHISCDELMTIIRMTQTPTGCAALREAARPFAHPDFHRIYVHNTQGDNSIVFQRNDAILTIGDFRRIAALLEKEG